MRKNILSIVSIVIGFIGLLVGAIIIKDVTSEEKNKDEMIEFLESTFWERLNMDNLEMEDLSMSDTEFYYTSYEMSENSVIDRCEFDFESNTFIITEGEEGNREYKVEILDYSDFHILLNIDGTIIDFIPSTSYENTIGEYPYEGYISSEVKEYMKKYTACYDIKSISKDKITFGLPANIEGYDTDSTDEVKLSDSVEYAKLQLVNNSNYTSTGCLQLANGSDSYVELTADEAKEEVNNEDCFELLWYNDKLEVEKVVFCTIDKEEYSEWEKDINEALETERWYRQELSDGTSYVKEVEISFVMHWIIAYLNEELEMADFTFDYETMVIESEAGNIKVVDYSDWHLTLEYEGVYYDLVKEYFHTDSPVLYDVAVDYLEGYTGKFTVVSIGGTGFKIAPPVYQDGEEYYTEYIGERIFASDAVFEELILADEENIYSHRTITLEEVKEKLDDDGCFAYYWYNENMEVSKLVLYEVLESDNPLQMSLNDLLISKNWYRTSEGHGCGEEVLMTFSEYNGFGFICQCGTTIDNSELYSTYSIEPGTNTIKLSGFEETTMEVLLYSDYHIVVNYKGMIMDFMSEKMCAAVPKIYDESEEYVKGYSGVYTLAEYGEDTLKVGPPNYDIETGLNEYIDELKLSDNIVFENVSIIETNSSNGTTVEVEYYEVEKEAAIESINTDGSFGFVWFNENLEVTKIVFYGITEIYGDLEE